MIPLQALNVFLERVLVRQDLNVPLKDGVITSTARIDRALDTIRWLVARRAGVLLMSHLGRPEEGQHQQQFSLAPVADYLTTVLHRPVRLITDYLDNPPVVEPCDVVLLENVRFNVGEGANDSALARKYASLCDIYVMDAFGTAHRAQASTHGVGQYAPMACAGPLLCDEIDALGKALDNPASPMVAIIGGAKVSTKLIVLESLLAKVDTLVPGGGIANTFIAAAGFNVGRSLYEPELVPEAMKLMHRATARGSAIPLPEDVVTAKALATDAEAVIKSVAEVADDDWIVDIGPRTIECYAALMQQAGTILWNGPVGVFEFPAFATGTRSLGQAIAESNAYSLAGGGDTLAAIEQFNLTSGISYISTGGGAFIEFIEGRELAAIQMLRARC